MNGEWQYRGIADGINVIRETIIRCNVILGTMATSMEPALQEYHQVLAESRRLQGVVEHLLGKKIFTSFCASCLVHDADDAHKKDDTGVMYAFRCTRKGRPKALVDRALNQVKAYCDVLKNLADDLEAKGWKAASGGVEVKVVEEYVEEPTSTGVEELKKEIERREAERVVCEREMEEMREELSGAKKMIDSLKLQLSHESVRPKTTGLPTTGLSTATPTGGRDRRRRTGDADEEVLPASSASTYVTSTASSTSYAAATTSFPTMARHGSTSATGIAPSSTSTGLPRPTITPRGTPVSAQQRLKLIADSKRVISVTIDETSDVVNFVLSLNSLQSSIRDFFGSEDDHTKILCANAHFLGNIKITGDQILEIMGDNGEYDFEVFFEKVFKMSFPSPDTALDCGFRKISQNYPTPTTIVGYARRFRVFVDKLGLKLRSQYLKFIEGLSNSEVRASILRYPYHTLAFNDLVEYAVGLENSLSAVKTQSVQVKVCHEQYADEEDVECVLKIMGKSLKDYQSALSSKGLGRGKRCYNCFSGDHFAKACRSTVCRFCRVPTDKAGHLSIFCPKCPKDLRRYMEERKQFNIEQGSSSKYGAEGDRYHEEVVEFSFDHNDLD